MNLLSSIDILIKKGSVLFGIGKINEAKEKYTQLHQQQVTLSRVTLLILQYPNWELIL